MTQLKELRVLLQHKSLFGMQEMPDMPFVCEEANRYATDVYHMLSHGCSVEDLTDYLWAVESDNLERPLWPDQNRRLAQWLLDWWATFHQQVLSQSEHRF